VIDTGVTGLDLIRTTGMSVAPRDDPDQFGTVPFYASIGKAFVTMCGFIPVLFLIEALNTVTHNSLDEHGGIWARHLSGLDGLIFAPFLHASFAHVYSNAVPLLLTGTFVLAGGTLRFIMVTVFVALTSGLAYWIFGSKLVAVGASGVIFGYLGYLLMRGLVERSWWNIAVALFIGLLYGYSIYAGLIHTGEFIAWQAHLGGLLGGLAAAIVFRRRRPNAEPPRIDDLSTTLPFPPSPTL
jgi:membrane associated rhomboid family serine protease